MRSESIKDLGLTIDLGEHVFKKALADHKHQVFLSRNSFGGLFSNPLGDWLAHGLPS